MNEKELKKVLSIFKSYKKIGLVYLFGSRATGKVGPLSDYDFAVYLDEKDSKKRFDARLELMGKISRVFKTDAIDLCIINDIKSPEFKYNIVKEGKVIFEREPFKILIEPRILNEYFDFHCSLIEHNLTKTL
ncbi:MAG: nucleotidyltransferase domain-containing protein [bacterium]|nr:nucleotidyltransferase domain-containing protein [bacterium]